MPLRRLKVAVSGMGRMGARHALNYLNRTPRAELVAVFTPNVPSELKWAREHLEPQNVRIYTDYHEMLLHPGLEAVVIATVTAVHAEQAVQAIQANKHVLCEKPLDIKVDVAQQVIDTASRKPHLKVMCGMSRRFDSSYRDAWARTARGDLGRPTIFRSQTCDKRDHSKFFVDFSEASGGLLVDCNIHDIDLALWFLSGSGSEDLVMKSAMAVGVAALESDLEALGDVDNVVSIVEFWGGKIAYFFASRMMASGQHDMTEIIGTDGKIVVNGHPVGSLIEMHESTGIRREIPENFYGRFEQAFVREASEFVASCLDDTPVPISMKDALTGLEIACTLTESLRSGTRINFDKTGKRL